MMNGPIAQIVALTCHGNAFLQGACVRGFFPGNSTCVFCDRVTFVILAKVFFGKSEEKEVAKTPEEWFTFIKSAGAKGIRLSWTPQNDPQISDRMSAGFVGGGGTWSVEVLLPDNRSEFWIARWEVWNQDAPEQRIWRVTYCRVVEKETATTGPPDLQRTTTRLTLAIREILSFSVQYDCGGFTQSFKDALDILESRGENLDVYHKDLAPDGALSRDGRAILSACQKAWVFGGMGSWNDMGFAGAVREEYERVSEQLFCGLNTAMADAANTSYYKPNA